MLDVRENKPLSKTYQVVRDASTRLCAPLERDDYQVQSADFVSPPKWHLAHTTWFYETFLLKAEKRGYEAFHPAFSYLFNSYYETVGKFHARPQRGILSRPTLDEVRRYRAHVDAHMREWLGSATPSERSLQVLEVGLQHEVQHQELLLMDIKHILATNPLKPKYREDLKTAHSNSVAPMEFQAFNGGLHTVGYSGNGFCYDNEKPLHTAYLEPFAIASRLVTNGEYLKFIEDGGYERPELWLSDGWDVVRAARWDSPAYWSQDERRWWLMTLGGVKEVDPNEPVCHVSFYEADAFARWAKKRLPTEVEWEVAARAHPIEGNFLESDYLHPTPMSVDSNKSNQFFGDVWEWTLSPYTPYPGYVPYEGALGEYNGKFMCNQFVLRGGACVTPQSHTRYSYRNFYHPGMRWQFSGFRLANS
ncbi:MAG: ergothioneine biosynthesis protein EgtB [Bdellovibrionales bacterium]|nr:ergothioneine biosynthesis protein EgtB [Bdellovibrionales bacterium]